MLGIASLSNRNVPVKSEQVKESVVIGFGFGFGLVVVMGLGILRDLNDFQASSARGPLNIAPHSVAP
jgi:hypothetical protein